KPCFFERRRTLGWKVRFTAKPLAWSGGECVGRGQARYSKRIDEPARSRGCTSATGAGRASAETTRKPPRPASEVTVVALWTSSCGSASRRCTVPGRSTDRPGGARQSSTTPGHGPDEAPRGRLARQPSDLPHRDHGTC